MRPRHLVTHFLIDSLAFSSYRHGHRKKRRTSAELKYSSAATSRKKRRWFPRFLVSVAMYWLFYLSLINLSFAVWSQPIPGNPLRNFQVSQPLPFPTMGNSCDVLLVHHLFSNSFGQPAVVEYDPPNHCGTPGTWAAIGLNITATCNGVE